MDYTDEYRSHAAECQRMAEKSALPRDRAAWLRLAEAWLNLIAGDRGKRGQAHNGASARSVMDGTQSQPSH